MEGKSTHPLKSRNEKKWWAFEKITHKKFNKMEMKKKTVFFLILFIYFLFEFFFIDWSELYSVCVCIVKDEQNITTRFKKW